MLDNLRIKYDNIKRSFDHIRSFSDFSQEQLEFINKFEENIIQNVLQYEINVDLQQKQNEFLKDMWERSELSHI